MIRVAGAISRFAVGVTALGIVLMLLLVVVDVLLRAVLNIAIPGNDTIVASYLMVATIFLPLAMLQILDENIAVDALYQHFPAWMKDLLDVLAHLLTAAFYLLLSWVYLKVAIESFEVKEYVTGTWDVPIWPARIIMPVGLFLGGFAAVVKTVTSLCDAFRDTPHPPHDPSGVF